MASAEKNFNPQHLKGKSEAEIVTVLQYDSEKLLYFTDHRCTP